MWNGKNFRIALGAFLILLGGLIFLERLGLLRGVSNYLWGALFLIGAGYFIYLFSRDPRGAWWAIIPGLVLLSLAGEVFLPAALRDLGGALFLGGIGASFWIVYLTDRARWWAIIPGGVLLTLAAVTIVTPHLGGIDSGAVFFLGLGITFLLVAMLPNPFGRMQWAYIPAVVLLIMGAVIGSTSMHGMADFVWPAALILVGLAMIFRFFSRRPE